VTSLAPLVVGNTSHRCKQREKSLPAVPVVYPLELYMVFHLPDHEIDRPFFYCLLLAGLVGGKLHLALDRRAAYK